MPIDHARELERRFRNTFVGVKTDKHIVPRRVENVRDGDASKTVRWVFSSSTVDTPIDPKEIEKSIQTLPTTFGMMAVSGALYYLYKLPYRQFKAGFHSDNVSMFSLQNQELRMMGKKTSGVESSGVLNFIFNPQYVPFNEGIHQIEKGKVIGFALNRKFGVGLARGFPRPCVFYKQFNLGALTENNTLILLPQHHHLLEELSQYIQCECGGSV